ncbi:TetR/AcrR family transcriptional regulator [Glycomyces harbinensis]|uniref:Transcriptional regulator, TetR family n=1 Tax=Glycomyces harbinensis TaxID=58114 RepID=A0A1G6VXB2_9ACTN|nr:TetR/AcrR family transcriptional regulator [Glycomyces harbinensis]SDD58219.1 transcriptional regulator, TetR family [Glycomyces harbinensis]
MGQGEYELFWGDRSRPGRGRPPGLSREGIVAEAVAIADAEGLQKVSMKHLAERLGSGVMSLYRHVPGKDELVILMYDSLMAEPLPEPEADTLRDLLLAWGRAVKDMLTAHPWALKVATSHRSMGPNEAAWLDATLARLDAVDMPPRLAMIAILTVDYFALGAVRPEIGGSESSEELFRFLADPAVNSRFPHLARMAAPGSQPEPPLDDHFEFGLGLVVDGLERYIESAR